MCTGLVPVHWCRQESRTVELNLKALVSVFSCPASWSWTSRLLCLFSVVQQVEAEPQGSCVFSVVQQVEAEPQGSCVCFQLSSKLKQGDPQKLHAGHDSADPAWLTQLCSVCQGYEVCCWLIVGLCGPVVGLDGLCSFHAVVWGWGELLGRAVHFPGEGWGGLEFSREIIFFFFPQEITFRQNT